MNLQPEGRGFESQTGKIKLAIDPKLSFKSKSGFSKHCSENNCASECLKNLTHPTTLGFEPSTSGLQVYNYVWSKKFENIVKK